MTTTPPGAPQPGTADSTPNHRSTPPASGTPNPPVRPVRRGRPPGSAGPTREQAALIIAFIRAGAFDYVAAEAAGVSVRTFRDWIARGEGTHSSRASNPKLRRFAADVRRARAEARVGVETRVCREQPALWLKWAARSQPHRPGWSDPAPTRAGVDEQGDSIEDRIRAYRARQEAEARQGEPSERRGPIPVGPTAYDHGNFEQQERPS